MKPKHRLLLLSAILAQFTVIHAAPIYSWETGTEGWNGNNGIGSTIATTPTGVTEGAQALAITTPMASMWYAEAASVYMDSAKLQESFTDATELKLDVSYPNPGYNSWYGEPTVEIIIQGENVSWVGLGAKPVAIDGAPQTLAWPLTVGQAAGMASGSWGQVLVKCVYGNGGSTATSAVFYIDNLSNTIAVEPPPVSSLFWKGDVNPNWSSLNWTSDDAGTVPGGSLPTDGSAGVAFSTPGAANQETILGANQSVSSVVLMDGAGPVTVGGTHSLTLGAGGIWISPAAASLTIDTTGGLQLGESQTWKNNSFSELVVASPISGPGTLIKGGVGPVLLANANLHTAGTVVRQGTLTIGNVNALGAATASLDMEGGTLDLNGFSPTLGNLTGGSGAVILNSTATPCLLTLDDSAGSGFTCSINDGFGGGAVSVIKKGVGTVTASGAGDFTGPLTIEDGVFIANAGIYGAPNATSLGAGQSAGRKVMVQAPGHLTLGSNNVLGNAAGNTSLLPEIMLQGSVMETLRYNIIGDVTLDAAEITNSSTDAGNYEAYQFNGRIKVTGSISSYISGTKGNHLSDNTVFEVADVSGDSFEDLYVTTPLIDQSGDFASAAGGLTKTGSGTMTMLAANTYGGDTRVEEGVLAFFVPGLSDTGLLEISAGASVHLDYAGTDVVGSLKLGTTLAAVGIYGAINSGAQYETAMITGPGLIEVGVPDPYISWIEGFPSLTGDEALRGSDPDLDGLTNLQEFAFNDTPDNSASSGKCRSSVETINSERLLVLTLPVRDGAVFVGNSPATADLTVEKLSYQIGGADDLSSFDRTVSEIPAAASELPPLDAGWIYRSFRLDGNIGGATPRGPRGFLRAAVVDIP